MIHTKQTAKRLIQSKKARSNNKRYLSLIKTTLKNVLNHNKPLESYHIYQSIVDRAVKKNVIKKNKGNRLKSAGFTAAVRLKLQTQQVI